jgi:hypothetical protein
VVPATVPVEQAPAPAVQTKIYRWIDIEGIIYFTYKPTPPFPLERLATGRELNLFRYYEPSLRLLLRGDSRDGGLLGEDLGSAALYAFRVTLANGDFTRAVNVLSTKLHLTEGERVAWTRELPLLMLDENRPSWQKAGVQR